MEPGTVCNSQSLQNSYKTQLAAYFRMFNFILLFPYILEQIIFSSLCYLQTAQRFNARSWQDVMA